MDEETFIKTWQLIEAYHKKYLREKGVKLSLLKDKNGYTKNALVLIKLAEGYPQTKVVSKKELTDFMKSFYPDINDVQQGRHLGMQQGWYIVSGRRGDENIPKDSYKLISLTEPHPSFMPDRRKGFEGDFEAIKKIYHYRCASCGSKEGEFHFMRDKTVVKLEKGHMNPALPLEEGNIIPQCQICNQPDRNRWIYDKTGRVIAIANTPDGFRAVEKFIKKSSPEVLRELHKLIDACLERKE